MCCVCLFSRLGAPFFCVVSLRCFGHTHLSASDPYHAQMQTDGRPTRRLLLPAFLSSAATPLAKFRMNPQKALYWSLTNLDIGGIMELLSMPAIDIDERDTARGLQTVLMRLCHLHISDDDRDTILRLIISREPDVNVQDSSGRTALAHACIAERTDVIECLARIPQCDPNVRDNDGNTPLLYAVKSRKVKVVQAMLSFFSGKGLKVDAVNNKGMLLKNKHNHFHLKC